jgi:hypothetical protein
LDPLSAQRGPWRSHLCEAAAEEEGHQQQPETGVGDEFKELVGALLEPRKGRPAKDLEVDQVERDAERHGTGHE